MTRSFGLQLAFVGLVVSIFASAAEACDCYGRWGVNRFFNSDRELPYYAEFPPVYYSYPVPRTYGYSPYAYPSSVMTPTLEQTPEPMTIINPHVEQPASQEKSPQAKKSQTAARRSAQPLIVENPFVRSSGRVLQASLEN